MRKKFSLIEINQPPVTYSADETFKTPIHLSPNIYKKRKSDQIIQIEKRLDEAYNHLKKASEKPKRDKCSLYRELLGKKLSELDEQTQEYAMFEIDKFVYGLKQKKYATQNYNPQYTAPVSTICNQPSTFSTSTFHSPPPTACTYTTHHHQYLNILTLNHRTQVFRCHLKICHSYQSRLICNNIIIIDLHTRLFKIKVLQHMKTGGRTF